MKKILLFIFLLTIYTGLYPQSYDIKFNHLTINDGLSLSSIYCIIQDNQGYMWFGTEDGLNRYDGYSFKIYRPDYENSNSLSEKWIKSIFEDSKNNLWIVTENGLNKFDTKREKFTVYLNNQNDINSISDNLVTTIFEDSDSTIWVGTENGLNKLIA